MTDSLMKVGTPSLLRASVRKKTTAAWRFDPRRRRVVYLLAAAAAAGANAIGVALTVRRATGAIANLRRKQRSPNDERSQHGNGSLKKAWEIKRLGANETGSFQERAEQDVA
jgi:hypothetical protein